MEIPDPSELKPVVQSLHRGEDAHAIALRLIADDGVPYGRAFVVVGLARMAVDLLLASRQDEDMGAIDCVAEFSRQLEVDPEDATTFLEAVDEVLPPGRPLREDEWEELAGGLGMSVDAYRTVVQASVMAQELFVLTSTEEQVVEVLADHGLGSEEDLRENLPLMLLAGRAAHRILDGEDFEDVFDDEGLGERPDWVVGATVAMVKMFQA